MSIGEQEKRNIIGIVLICIGAVLLIHSIADGFNLKISASMPTGRILESLGFPLLKAWLSISLIYIGSLNLSDSPKKAKTHGYLLISLGMYLLSVTILIMLSHMKSN